MIVRCKFVCSYKDEKSGRVSLSPVYSGSDENKAFFEATPSGEIHFNTVNAVAFNSFAVGCEYYIDFAPADAAS